MPTPSKINMEPKVMEVGKVIFLLNWVIFRFQPLIFRCRVLYLLKFGLFGGPVIACHMVFGVLEV